jgi:hypothetical protein
MEIYEDTLINTFSKIKVGNFNENVDLTVHDSKFKIDDNKIIAYKE